MRRPGRAVRHRKSRSPVTGLMRMLHLILRSPDRPTAGYDAFISYSHLEDDALAATLQAGLETFATPWSRSRTLRVFRDTRDLTATPGLLTEIIGALSASRWFVLVASERAAHSRWVNEEVSWWLANKGRKRFLIALSDGEIRWEGQDFDWARTTALPPVLAGAFTEEPGWIDLREVKKALAKGDGAASAGRPRRLTRHRARRQVGDWVAALAAPIREVAKDSLVGEHLRYRKRTRRMVQAVLAAMLALTVAASVAAAVAASQLAQARLQTRVAISRELAALSGNLLTKHLDLAELFAVEAYQLDPSPQALAALFQSVTVSPHLVTYLPAGGQVSAIAGSADGQVIVAGRSDGTVLRWSLPDTQPTVIARMTTAVTGVSVNDIGTAVVAFSQAAVMRWGTGLGARPLRMAAGQTPIGARVSPSGRFTAVATIAARTGPYQYFELALYGPRANKVKTTRIRNVTTGPQYLAFTSDSRLVTLDVDYGTWYRLSVPALRTLGGRANFFGNEYTAALSPNGEFIGNSNGTGTVPVWEIKEGSTTSVQHPWNVPIRGAAPAALAINAPGTLVAQADNGSIYVSGINHSSTSAAPLTLAGNSVINTGGLAFAGPSELVSASGDLLTLWNLRQYSRIATETSITAPESCRACPGPLVAVQSDGRKVAVVANNGGTMTAQVLPSGGKPTVTRSLDSSYGMPLWSQDGRQLLAPTVDGGAQIWSASPGFARSGKWPASLSLQRALGYSQDQGVLAQPDAVQVRPGGRQVVEVYSTGAIAVRNVATGKVDEFIKGPSSLADYGEAFQNFTAVDTSGQVAAVVTPQGIVVTSISTRRSRTLPGTSATRSRLTANSCSFSNPTARFRSGTLR